MHHNQLPAEATVGDPDGGHALPTLPLDAGMAALCAEAVGAVERIFSMTLEFLKTRQQFGTSLGRLRALQYRAVDRFTALAQARSMALYATLVRAEPDADRHRAAMAAKAQIGRAARHIGPAATQLHGPMGRATDYARAHLFKRLTMIDSIFGHSQHQLRALAQAGGLYRD